MWMQAMEAQLNAYSTIDDMVKKASRYPDLQKIVMDHGFMVDRTLLKHAMPYAWATDTTAAVMAASQSVPPSTQINGWTFDMDAVWWHFETPLPFETLEVDNITLNRGVRALLFGWMGVQGGGRVLGCSAWCDAEDTLGRKYKMTPSQTWLWQEGHTFAEMLATNRVIHARQYGPGGKYANSPSVGVDQFIAATEGLSRFIAAGLIWIAQKVVTLSDGAIERHRRKDFARTIGRPLHTVKVVQLRRTESQPHEDAGQDVAWSCRWVVDGHFRNQRVGPNLETTRLVWISAYVKGPDDQPLKVPSYKIYSVSR